MRIKSLLLLAALVARASLAYGASTSVDVPIQVTHTDTAPAVPAGAQAAGFTTLAFDGDFSKGIDLGCWPGQDTAAHTWYQGIWYAGGFTVPCGRVNLVNDPAAGKQVVDLTWNSTDSATYGATMLSTINQALNHVTDFPNGYYETIFRVQTTPDIIGIGGTWWNGWMWGSRAAQGTGDPVIEYDIMENHGEFPTYLTSGVINWGLGGPGHGGGYTYESFRGGYDYRQYHKFGYRITGDGANITACGYYDDVFQGCANANAFGAELTQRNFLMASVGWGCNFTNGYGNCINEPLALVYACPAGTFSGNVCIQIQTDSNFSSLVYQQNNPSGYISGVTGIPGANGVWPIHPLDGTHFALLGSNFSGGWTGGGQLNAYQKIDMFLQSFRVWSCPAWQTTMCNGTVLSGAP